MVRKGRAAFPKWLGVACGHPRLPLGGGAGPTPGFEGGRAATPKGRWRPRPPMVVAARHPL